MGQQVAQLHDRYMMMMMMMIFFNTDDGLIFLENISKNLQVYVLSEVRRPQCDRSQRDL